MAELARRRIHRADDVGVGFVAGLLIVDRPGGIVLVNPLGVGFEIRAVPRFVAQRPNNDGSVVFVPLEHPHGSVEVGVGPIGVLGQGFVAIAHAVAFDVGFVYQVKAEPVTQVVPGGMVGIVGAAHGVDVVLFHHQDVLLHPLDSDGLASVGVEFVAVDPLEEHALAIDQQVALADFHLPESDLDRDDFERLATRLEREHQLIQIRVLRRPLARIGNRCADLGLAALSSGRGEQFKPWESPPFCLQRREGRPRPAPMPAGCPHSPQ